MLADWENKFRDHWPHHYRDVLDKINSPFGMAIVSDTQTNAYACPKPLARLEKSFKEPTIYRLIVQDPNNNKILEEQKFAENQLNESIESFIKIIGGWKEKSENINNGLL